MKCGCYLGTGIGKRIITIDNSSNTSIRIIGITKDFKVWVSTEKKSKHIEMCKNGFKIDDHKSVNEYGKMYYWIGCSNVGWVA